MDVEDLSLFLDEEVQLHLESGEMLRAFIVFVDAQQSQIIVNMIETTHPENHEQTGAACVVQAADVRSVSVLN